MQEPIPSGSSSTILNDLERLYTSQSAQIATLPHLHAYAPSTHKGKSKAGVLSVTDQMDVLTRLKESVEGVRKVLGDDVEGDLRIKLLRALKDVSLNQQSLLPTMRTLTTHFNLLPTFKSTQNPIQCIADACLKLDLQVYSEESQFGLLKTGMTIAGKCFVVDLEFEFDSVPEDVPPASPSSPVPPVPPTPGQSSHQEPLQRGKIRLGEIRISYVKGDKQGKNNHIAHCLSARLEKYLHHWNEPEPSSPHSLEWVLGLDRMVNAVHDMLSDLKDFDVVASLDGEIDWYAELETLGRVVQTTSSIPNAEPTIFPSFYLLPGDKQKLQIRPPRPNEHVPVVPGVSEDIEEEWLKGNWVVEYLGGTQAQDGLVIRRSWLSDTSSEPGSNGSVDTVQDGLIRVEHLLYRQLSNAPGPAIPFPYTCDFFHPSTGTQAVTTASDETPPDQRWGISEPGPEGFLLGRVGLPKSLIGFEKIVEVLRFQLVLNVLFESVFEPRYLDTSEVDEQGGLDDLLNAPPAIAITARLLQRSFEASLSLSGMQPPTLLSITMTPLNQAPYVDLRCTVTPSNEALQQKLDKGILDYQNGVVDAVDIVKHIVQSVR